MTKDFALREAARRAATLNKVIHVYATIPEKDAETDYFVSSAEYRKKHVVRIATFDHDGVITAPSVDSAMEALAASDAIARGEA